MFDKLHNTHYGATGIVIGNGPSLKEVPCEFLDRFPTLGSNRIYLRYIPTYYAVINELLIQQFADEINEVPSIKFAREFTTIKAYPLHLIETPMFSYAPTKWLYDGHNTTFVLLQLAFFMGFKRVYLVGVDHRYAFEGQPNERLYMAGDDPNHFSPEYFKGSEWQAPDLAVSEQAYKMAKEAYDLNKREIINLTPGSALNVFDRGGQIWVP